MLHNIQTLEQFAKVIFKEICKIVLRCSSHRFTNSQSQSFEPMQIDVIYGFPSLQKTDDHRILKEIHITNNKQQNV